MNKNLITRYIWLVDTLRSRGRLTRAEINELWLRSPLSEGNPLPERTFFHYRRGIEEIFNIDIACNSRGEYYIKNDGPDTYTDGNPDGRTGRGPNNGLTNWLLDSFAINTMLADTPDIADRIEIEEVPSAREFLPTVLEAVRQSQVVRFDYSAFNRSMTEKAIEFRPYFLKRYKQRWYMIGERGANGDIRTYALDRVKAMEPTGKTFKMPRNLKISDLFGSIVGVTSSKAEERTVRLRASRTQAKYLRALPLHSSQQEEETDSDSSVFHYRLKLNYELVHEIMGMGEGIVVVEPQELKLMVASELKKTLDQYGIFS